MKAAAGKKNPRRAGATLHRPVVPCAPCPKCRGTTSADCPTCHGAGVIEERRLPADYAPDEDPFSGVIDMRAFLRHVTGHWRGISDIGDVRAPEDIGGDIGRVAEVARLDPEERRVLELQAEGKRNVEMAAALNWSPFRLRRVIQRLNTSIRDAWDRIRAERTAEEG